MTRMRQARIGVALALAAPACTAAPGSPAPAPEDAVPIAEARAGASLDELLRSGLLDSAVVAAALRDGPPRSVVMSEGMPVACPLSVPYMPVSPVDSSGDRWMNAGPVKRSPCPPLALGGSGAGPFPADSARVGVPLSPKSMLWFYPADSARVRGRR